MTVAEHHSRSTKNCAWRRLLLLSAVIAFVVAMATFFWLSIGSPLRLPIAISNESMKVEGIKRTYRLVIPDSTRGQESFPLVFALHGALDTTEEMAVYSDLDRLAAEKGFLLVYLQGRLLNWPPSIPAENSTYIDNDLRFFEAMCDEMANKHGADLQRIYVVGVSQGGAMANLLTAKCSERIAATVCCCGWMPHPLDEAPLNTKYKCPILFLVGSEDRQVPPEMVRKGHAAFAREGHPVEFRLIPGLGHGWPGVNEEIWEFLEGKRLP
jgi:poly(3-hydroxybutyrate) depolymerase